MSTIAVEQLFGQLEALGCILTVEGDALRVKPLSVVPADMRDLIRDNKAAIVEAVRQRGNLSAIADRPPEDDPFATPPRAPKPTPAALEWPDDVRPLIEWFATVDGYHGTQKPFGLRPGVRVTDTDRFLGSLRSDVEAGPTHPRATGLVIDLADLRDAVDGHRVLPLRRSGSQCANLKEPATKRAKLHGATLLSATNGKGVTA
jgi:hypothetical protein